MPLVIPESLRLPLAAPVAVLGGGVSGRGATALLASLGAAAIVYDAAGREFTVAAAAAAGHRLAVFSPGFAPGHPWLARARAAGCACWSELDFASAFWRGRIVAVTGTNGKTTLCEFLVHALRAIGRPARATGNIGFPLSQWVADLGGGDPSVTAVCEVSSFQAEALAHFRAEATLWTNFAEDHLDRHGSLAAYAAAKAALVARTARGRWFAGPSVPPALACLGLSVPPATAVVAADSPGDPALAGTVFAAPPQRENFLLAAAWWRAEGLDPAALTAAAASFRLGRHRLARVAEIGGVTYWNDSKATNFHAVEAALAGLRGPVSLIAGGRSKGGDLAGFVERIAPRLDRIFLLGETRAALAAASAAAGLAHEVCPSLEAAVQAAARAAEPGSHVLLSPGFASFDLFRSYEDRGDRFERAVASLPDVPARLFR
jgi:UDP-N-acetylmuramoylalanine--D-glutamate ligase